MKKAPMNEWFFFAEENGNLLLWQYAGDPDAWKYVEFEKKKTNETQTGS